MDFFDMTHQAYRRMKSCRYDRYGHKCRSCGAALGTTYLEERLYAVRCEKCGTITLVEARNPAGAEAVVGIGEEV